MTQRHPLRTAKTRIKQENIEQITFNPTKSLEDTADPGNIDNDWIANFFDKCSNVSDKEMQELWGKILAGEANNPGSFSKRTINTVASLDKTEANLFTSLCRFGISIGKIYPLVFNLEHKIYTDHKINFESLLSLEVAGLITFNHATGFVVNVSQTSFFTTYNNEIIVIKIPDNTTSQIPVGKILLTKMGLDLFPICGASPIPEFISIIKNEWDIFIPK